MAKQRSYNERLLRIPVGELENKISGSVVRRRKEILGELLVEFYDIVESDASSKIIEAYQKTLNELFSYIELNKLIDEEIIQNYRRTYRGIVEQPLKKALEEQPVIFRKSKPIHTKSIEDHSEIKPGISVPAGINTTVPDSQYNF